MAIPPFPSQDLAKLVLGYLVEEQLMTAYDEFLHASPYLDAQRNEYDRIIMHSLRNILAEYRAVRIYVETCKPIALRKKLFQCTNLLEIVKYLVRHIDVNKLQLDANTERVSFDLQDVTTSKIGCDACISLRLGSCTCTNRKKNVSFSKSVSNTESIDAVESAQATSLSHLPGLQETPEDKQIKVLERHTYQSALKSEPSHESLAVASSSMRNANIEQSSVLANLHIQPNANNIMSTSAAHKTNATTASLECSKNIAEFNTVLNQVCNNSVVTGSIRDNNKMYTENVHNNRLSTAGTFKDFTTGVGGIAKTNISVPDSSTSENINIRLPIPERENNTHKKNIKVHKKKCVVRVGNVKHDFTEMCNEVIDVDTIDLPPNPKPDDQKVTILSDVTVGNDDGLLRLAPVLKNATSTPLFHMQTVFINGTPVYNPKPPEQKCTYTRDEIMAMPTIILVPSSGPSQTFDSTGVQSQAKLAQSSSVTTTACNLPTSIKPLTVDVSHNSNNLPNIQNEPELNVQNTDGKSGLVKTLEALKNASVPKDCIVAGSSSTSTPHMLPPKRKSSSTPRRSSHVRVLNFNTPRRNLNETINENPKLEDDPDNNEEIVLSKSTNLSLPQDSLPDNTLNTETKSEAKTSDTRIVNLTEETKSVHKKPVQRKKSNWDADLRALAVASESVEKAVRTPKPNSKQIVSVEKTKKKNCVKSSITPNTKKSKKKVKLVNTEAKKLDNNQSSDCSATVTTTSVNEKLTTSAKEPDKAQNKSSDGEHIDTPEVERLSLHNEIGVKLNISDILETPYKQALYDIQMETPRFLGPDLPDDPMSDIKIMNIPTPRFLSTNIPFTPKPAQATPSSYSSRPTDYSSGGSYYKPDDQDYLPILEDVVCLVTSTHPKDKSKKTCADASDLTNTQTKEKCLRNRSSRPIRQCTKNVSYYKSPMINQTDDTAKKYEVSSCSDTISANSSFEAESTVTMRGDKLKHSTKSGNKKTPRSLKNRSPLKKVFQKPFMKIKPRRPTPTKNSSKKSNRKSPETIQHFLKEKSRNRSTSKDKCAVASLAKGQQQVVRPATKSRRKSSTPRKLYSTKTFNSESSGHDSPEVEAKDNTEKQITNSNAACVQDSDTEQLPLQWSDDGSQDTKLQESQAVSAANESDEISQIKEFIDKTIRTSPAYKDNEGCLHVDLVKRGFDVETAKIIERDLLNTPSREETHIIMAPSSIENKNNKVLERSVESDCSMVTNNLVINEDDDNEDIQFSGYECDEDSVNYLVVQHDSKKPSVGNVSQLKDKFSMEVCIDDGVVVRLRATALNSLFDQDPQELSSFIETNTETEIAVSSICNIDRLYTPLKDPIRDQCHQLFDSTLTSIDTPLKTESPKGKQDCTVSDIILEEDIEDLRRKMNERAEKRKRKRSYCSSTSEDSINENKKVKPETQFMLNSKDIKNLDIETVLSRLHGP